MVDTNKQNKNWKDETATDNHDWTKWLLAISGIGIVVLVIVMLFNSTLSATANTVITVLTIIFAILLFIALYIIFHNPHHDYGQSNAPQNE